jgi:hypothetical protein
MWKEKNSYSVPTLHSALESEELPCDHRIEDSVRWKKIIYECMAGFIEEEVKVLLREEARVFVRENRDQILRIAKNFLK